MRNRDVKALTAVKYATLDLQDLEEKLMWHRERLTNATQRLSDMPRGGGMPTGLDAAMAKIIDMEERYAALCKECCRELDLAETLLGQIRSRQARTFARMKYMLGRSDRQIQEDMEISRGVCARLTRAIEDAESMGEVEWEDGE